MIPGGDYAGVVVSDGDHTGQEVWGSAAPRVRRGREPVSVYVRRRRLEQARAELAAAPRPDVSEVAAHWHFADASHFIRAFRKQYGDTPGRLARVGGAGRG